MADTKEARSPSFATGQGIICAGLPRSGTLSLAKALEILGMGRIHHGLGGIDPREVYAWSHAAWCSFPYLRTRLSTPDGRLPFYLPKYDPLLPWSRADWDRLVGRYRCTTDIGSIFTEQLVGAYPEARVILVERPLDRWMRSFGRVLVDRCYYGIGGFIMCDLGPWADYVTTVAYRDVVMGWLGANSRAEAYKKMPDRHREHSEMVRRLVPANQLLEFNLTDGWGPLCKFLDVPVPDVPFPHANEEAELLGFFRVLYIMILTQLGKKLALAALGVAGVAVLSRGSSRGVLLDLIRSPRSWFGALRVW